MKIFLECTYNVDGGLKKNSLFDKHLHSILTVRKTQTENSMKNMFFLEKHVNACFYFYLIFYLRLYVLVFFFLTNFSIHMNQIYFSCHDINTLFGFTLEKKTSCFCCCGDGRWGHLLQSDVLLTLKKWTHIHIHLNVCAGLTKQVFHSAWQGCLGFPPRPYLFQPEQLTPLWLARAS